MVFCEQLLVQVGRWGEEGAQKDQFLLQARLCWTGVKDRALPVPGTGPIACCLSRLKGQESSGQIGELDTGVGVGVPPLWAQC